MMGDLRGSLYDLFGYFIPGLFAGAGLWLILWSIAWPSAVLDLTVTGEAGVLILLVAVVYTLGHLVQAVGNAIPPLQGVDIDATLTMDLSRKGSEVHKGLLSPATLEILNRAFELRYGPESLRMSPRDRYALIDESRVFASREGDREVYIYHHGFYRGMVVASGIIIVALLVRWIAGPGCILVADSTFCLGSVESALSHGVGAASGYAFWRRLKRFAEYRLVRAVMLWLAIASQSKGESGTERTQWRPAAEMAASAKTDQAVVRDAAGNALADGDSVTLIKDLKVKGTSLTLKQGTVIRSIRLTDDVEEIDCRHDGIKGLVLRTEFVRKR
jgi:protein PhnA